MNEPSAPPPTSPPPQPERRNFIRTMIVMAALLFIANEALLYYRWVTMSEPSCVLIIDAGPSLSGAEITVDSVELSRPLRATIGVNERFSIPFYLNAGDYTVKVKVKEDLVLEPMRVTLTRQAPGQRLDLTRRRPVAVPSTTPTF